MTLSELKSLAIKAMSPTVTTTDTPIVIKKNPTGTCPTKIIDMQDTILSSGMNAKPIPVVLIRAGATETARKMIVIGPR